MSRDPGSSLAGIPPMPMGSSVGAAGYQGKPMPTIALPEGHTAELPAGRGLVDRLVAAPAPRGTPAAPSASGLAREGLEKGSASKCSGAGPRVWISDVVARHGTKGSSQPRELGRRSSALWHPASGVHRQAQDDTCRASAGEHQSLYDT
jgi:hypothetical protein